MAKKRLVKDLTRVGQRVRTQRRKGNSPLWRRKALALWSFIVRRHRRCEACGCSDGVFDAHHVLPKERYQCFMFMPINGVCLCKQCHKIGRLSAHRNPLWFADWLRRCRPKTYEWAMRRLHDESKLSADFKAAYDWLYALIVKNGLEPAYLAMQEKRKEQAKRKKGKIDGEGDSAPTVAAV